MITFVIKMYTHVKMHKIHQNVPQINKTQKCNIFDCCSRLVYTARLDPNQKTLKKRADDEMFPCVIYPFKCIYIILIHP